VSPLQPPFSLLGCWGAVLFNTDEVSVSVLQITKPRLTLSSCMFSRVKTGVQWLTTIAHCEKYHNRLYWKETIRTRLALRDSLISNKCSYRLLHLLFSPILCSLWTKLDKRYKLKAIYIEKCENSHLVKQAPFPQFSYLAFHLPIQEGVGGVKHHTTPKQPHDPNLPLNLELHKGAAKAFSRDKHTTIACTLLLPQ